MMGYIKYGEELNNKNISSLETRYGKELFNAVRNHDSFELVNLSKIETSDNYCDVIVVDCINDAVPTKNKVGISFRERLALVCYKNYLFEPQVRALRKGFPVTFHQNYVKSGEPASLCLYSESWSVTGRTWTAYKHLNRIIWWLKSIASDNLHAEDQPLEPFYFNSPYQLVLPYDFDRKIKNINTYLYFESRVNEDNSFRLLFGKFNDSGSNNKKIHALVFEVPSIIHGNIEKPPYNLNELNNQFNNRDIDFYYILCEKIKDYAHNVVLNNKPENFFLIILNIPIKRYESGSIEKIQRKGFIINNSLEELGEKLGVLKKINNRYWKCKIIGENINLELNEWKHITLMPVEIIDSFSRNMARISSGISTHDNIDIKGILAGVGSLGSALLNIWSREGWGNWTIVDHDLLKPHNLARHIGYEFQVGQYKVNAAKDMQKFIFPENPYKFKAIPLSIIDKTNNEVQLEIKESDLLIDATTTLEVPRELSSRKDIKRIASTFITPSGDDSVLMIEDKQRKIPIHILESQYYKAIINHDWGNAHLTNRNGNFWAGVGCREASNILSLELIQLHSSILARQIRLKSQEYNASINIWCCNPKSNSVENNSVEITFPLYEKKQKWTIIWNEKIRDDLQILRKTKLPNETGGVILGYFDMVTSKIFIVDILPEPLDSNGNLTEFARGMDGLTKQLDSIKEKTANIVNYIGEWHSHPDQASSKESEKDEVLLKYLSSELISEGLPALMLIVANNEENWLIGNIEDE